MSFVIYNIKTTIILTPRNNQWQTSYKTEGAAKAARTRIIKAEMTRERPRFGIDDDFAIADGVIFKDKIEKQVTRTNLISGKEFQININAPACVDPSTETYHCM